MCEIHDRALLLTAAQKPIKCHKKYGKYKITKNENDITCLLITLNGFSKLCLFRCLLIW